MENGFFSLINSTYSKIHGLPGSGFLTRLTLTALLFDDTKYKNIQKFELRKVKCLFDPTRCPEWKKKLSLLLSFQWKPSIYILIHLSLENAVSTAYSSLIIHSEVHFTNDPTPNRRIMMNPKAWNQQPRVLNNRKTPKWTAPTYAKNVCKYIYIFGGSFLTSTH